MRRHDDHLCVAAFVFSGKNHPQPLPLHWLRKEEVAVVKVQAEVLPREVEVPNTVALLGIESRITNCVSEFDGAGLGGGKADRSEQAANDGADHKPSLFGRGVSRGAFPDTDQIPQGVMADLGVWIGAEPLSATQHDRLVALARSHGRRSVTEQLLGTTGARSHRVGAVTGKLLGRAPTPTELKSWADSLRHGDVVALSAQVASTRAYLERAATRFP